MANQPETTSMALFCDFENVALGVRDAKYEKFDIKKVLERLLLKGSIVVKKAYCDWDRYREFKAPMHEAAFELIEIPHVRQSGKNSADIRMVVDALDLCYTKSHVDTFVIISGDSDFSPLVSKLRENAKQVIGVGVKGSTSDLLMANCDEFIFYDDLVREQGARRRRAARANGKEAAPAEPAPGADAPRKRPSRRRKPADADSAAAPDGDLPVTLPTEPIVSMAIDDDADTGRSADERRQEALDLVVETVEALMTERGADDKIWGSMVKQTLKRRRPGFAESYYGYRSFNELLEDARQRGLLSLEHDEKSGGYVLQLV